MKLFSYIIRMKEIIKEYPLDNRYKVSNMGYVIGVKGYKLKPFIDKSNRSIVYTGRKDRYLHQIIAETFLNHTPCGYKVIVDHIDNNPQNNRLDNLQLISHRENLSKDKKNKTSKFTGVSKDSKINRYRTQVCLGGKVHYLGSYKAEDEAYIAYIDALYEYNEFIKQ